MSAIDAAVRGARRGIKCHQRGIVCRAVMWEIIRHALTAENVCHVLDALAPEEQSYLRRVYDEFPPSLWSCCSPEEHSRCVAIEQWCYGAASE